MALYSLKDQFRSPFLTALEKAFLSAIDVKPLGLPIGRKEIQVLLPLAICLADASHLKSVGEDALRQFQNRRYIYIPSM